MKFTKPGDTHFYAQFASNPPKAKKGTIHIVQLCLFLEPIFGCSWAAVGVVVASILSGKPFDDRLRIAAARHTAMSPSTTVCGWQADGDYSQGVKLMALCALALCVCQEHEDQPGSLQQWMRQFALISVQFTPYKSTFSRLAACWSETAVSHAVNERLTPIKMAKSLLALGLTDGTAVDQVCKQFSASPVALKLGLKQKATPRMQRFLDREALPKQRWEFHSDHYA